MTQEPQSNKNQTWVGLDVGTARIGVAVAVEEAKFAVPKCTVANVSEAAEVVSELTPTVVVVGWPLELDGTEGRATRLVDKFMEKLEESVDFEFEFVRWDERLTTAESTHLLRAAGKKAKEQRKVIDQVAATKILQSYLDAEQNK